MQRMKKSVQVVEKKGPTKSISWRLKRKSAGNGESDLIENCRKGGNGGSRRLREGLFESERAAGGRGASCRFLDATRSLVAWITQ